MGRNQEHQSRLTWSKPRLEKLSVDLSSVAGNRFPPGDNRVSNGKSTTPTS